MDKIDCLDHGFVRLLDHMGSDLSIVRAARVSFAADWRTGERESQDARLINYLWKHKHTSPFEACTLTFEVKAPIFVFRQWHRHRTQSYNEVSARYSELEEDFYLPEPTNVGVQSKSNKQGRDTDVSISELNARKLEVLCVEGHCKYAFRLYKRLIEQNWPRELARMVLPFNTYSRMFTTMNLLNLFRFLTLRLDSHAQYEIRVYAEAILELIKPLYPVATAVFLNNITEIL